MSLFRAAGACVVLLLATGSANGQGAIGYPTVAAAFQDVTSRSNVNISTQGGFVVVDEPAAFTLWTFTLSPHPAHPTVVRRAIVERAGAMVVEMAVLCEAERKACDQLVSEFQVLNEQLRQAIQGPR
jgi:hypothetical protein